tara:strand:+ start:226 stop:384 length:159 start_codon:yes stop_codon:yes gene_type:complete
MFLHFHLSRIIRDIEKIRSQTSKKEYIPKKWFSTMTNKDIDDISQNYLNNFF